MHAPDHRDPRRARKRARDRRRYRRELEGKSVAPVEYIDKTSPYLAKYKWFKEGDDHDDPRAIGDAIARMVQDAVEADAK